jgi:arylsulfatase A-like enzyme
LFVTLDQFRADCLSSAGHPVVRTPTLDAIAADGVRFARHYANAAPCSPGRAALYTGTYQMNNRVVTNGTPLDDRFDNIARIARRRGYRPTLFGYTDQAVDPRDIDDPHDARLVDYHGVLPGFDVGLHLPDGHDAWRAWLGQLGYEVGDDHTMLATEDQRPAEYSVTSFLTDHVVAWLQRQPADEPWFVHASYIRPHPPYCAPGEYASMYDPAQCPPAMPVPTDRHPVHDRLLNIAHFAAPTDCAALARLRAQYYGAITHVDDQLRRVVAAITERGEWDNTVVVITADHGDQLGDQGLMDKGGFFEASYRILAIVRDPRHPAGRGRVVEHFTEAVDIAPTVCDAIGADIPAQCDGLPLTPFLTGADPTWWRDSAHYEWDRRGWMIPFSVDRWPWDRRLERQRLAVQRDDRFAYVHFGDGSWRCFDLGADPTWQTTVTDPSVVLPLAQALLDWMGVHLDRTMTGMLVQDGGIGRRPDPRPVHP